MSDSADQLDPAILADLEREAPILSRLTRFARGLDRVRWFAHLGEPAKPVVRRLARDYLDALGFPEAELAILPTWEDAASAAETLDLSAPGWEAEELARADLARRALTAVSEEALSVAQSLIAEAVGETAKAAMEEQANYWDMDDEEARNLAVGAAAQSANSAGLLLLAAAADPSVEVASHPLALKFRLFEQGRWPVTLIGGSFSVF